MAEAPRDVDEDIRAGRDVDAVDAPSDTAADLALTQTQASQIQKQEADAEAEEAIAANEERYGEA